MALKTDIQGLVKNTMDLLAGFQLAEKITYYHVTDISYNPSTGASTPTSVTYSNKTAVLLTFTAEERTEDVVVITDRKVLIAYNDLKIVPTSNDYFTVNKTGERWEVKKVMGLPGEPMHKLHVRKV